MYNGIVVVKKEKGFTSFDAVAKLRGVFGQKKIGHTGTLDPDAEGVLPVCLGSATKACELLTTREKEYEAVLLLGRETDTQDITGRLLAEKPVLSSEEEVRAVISRFQGELLQTPPMYSALKVDGKKLCDLARAGKTVERKARKITVYQNEILWMDLPRAAVRFSCSRGTYIRTLCHEIGQALGCGGCMESLVRTRAAGFSIAQAVTIGELESAKERGLLEQFVQPVDEIFPDYPKLMVREQAQRLLFNGNPLAAADFDAYAGFETAENCTEAPVRVYDASGCFCAVYRFQKNPGIFKPVKMFLPL